MIDWRHFLIIFGAKGVSRRAIWWIGWPIQGQKVSRRRQYRLIRTKRPPAERRNTTMMDVLANIVILTAIAGIVLWRNR
jgi:hypothetical protein